MRVVTTCPFCKELSSVPVFSLNTTSPIELVTVPCKKCGKTLSITDRKEGSNER